MPVAIHGAAVLFETPHAFAADLTEPPGTSIVAGRLGGRPQPFPLSSGSLQSGQHPFPNSFPLELGDGAEDVHLQLAGGRRRVDAFGEADERNPKRLQFIEQCGSSSSVITCLRLRPSRSSRQQTSTSNRRRRASVTNWSSDGRRSLVPDTPRSTYSTAVQPRASTYRRTSCSWFSGS
jgi:hypothetical protein